MKKLSMLGIIGGAALLAAAPFSLQWSQKNVALSLDSADARIGRPLTATSVAGVHRRAYRRSAARFMQELPATAMGRIPVMAIRPTPATTHRSRTPATPHLTAAPTATTHPTATTGSPIPASMEGGVIISGGWPCGRWSPATPG
jgi:hypothetical protein